MKTRGRLIPLALVLLLGALPAAVQAAFQDLGTGARAPGMGNAFTALADDVYAIFYNPAGLGQLERPQASSSYSRLHMGLTDGSELGLASLAYAHPLRSGRWGALGGAWNRFSLSGVYTEQSLYASWGRRLLGDNSGRRLLAGISLKYLSRSFVPLPEAYNAKNELVSTGQADPVLTGNNSVSALDADVGLIYRMRRRFQLGLMVQHVNQPDVGFASADKLPMNIRFGAGYKTLWMNLAGELRMEPSPTGSTDRDIIVAAERFFPSLTLGQFGLRGSLGFGSRDWKQITTGLSYRINKIQFDYGFLIPIGTIQGTAGTHRLSLTFHFGAPTPDEEITQDLLSQAKRMSEGRTPQYGYEFSDTLRPRELTDEDLRDVYLYVKSGQYRKAHRRLIDLAKELPPDESIIRLSNRLALTAYYYPELTEQDEKWKVALSSSIYSFLTGSDRNAILFASYALDLQPSATQLENMVRQMEEGVGRKADRMPPNHPRSYLEELHFRVEAANNRGEYDKVKRLLEDILTLAPEDVKAVERIGSTYFMLGKYREAIETWEQALSREQDPHEQKALISYIEKARTALGEEAPPPTVEPAPLPARAAPRARPRRRAERNDPRDIERLYQKGTEHYARGERLQATAMFMRILQIDPDNVPAKKALQRLKIRR